VWALNEERLLAASPLHRLIYVSRACIDPCGPEPRRIIAVATQRNAELGVTGLLCFSGEHFAQLLEGPAAALETLMTAIRADERHTMLREWSAQEAPGARRLFPRWAMGYSHEERLDDALGRLVLEPHELPLETVGEVLFAGLDLYRDPAP
jgi:hypothetical protein